ncbi:MAG: hypothetical protein KZQ66_07695 [Candidatus Thiodiazotropha sp. (ex Lucinoma aequizonata)]|nr:hypothetical protein [Candidatus Thiodiazotropha sp. (ex Lucinoma aequizonata)]MCU7899926.1 hypothetical protein [Candidatus Thiodiazotropha sp. (ex Lucinoma aequizonata)]MCU7901883.1 hypothetical protein [Candidatus Thiodiazotropha sp. (ex Lucinoma aequizonata)]MCU7908246.1 hypothetical protein [Candidatus Thiodiazotropha sp. (ex Lucinoma aequizonata)]MCU7913413.1 hypothetical protein [Candidatus Thiodiazotropha sp. (ex Lucinoma aequizonata)]
MPWKAVTLDVELDLSEKDDKRVFDLVKDFGTSQELLSNLVFMHLNQATT